MSFNTLAHTGVPESRGRTTEQDLSPDFVSTHQPRSSAEECYENVTRASPRSGTLVPTSGRPDLQGRHSFARQSCRPTYRPPGMDPAEPEPAAVPSGGGTPPPALHTVPQKPPSLHRWGTGP